MNYLDILQEKVEAKKKEFGGFSPYSISCNDVLGLIQAAKAAQHRVQADGAIPYDEIEALIDSENIILSVWATDLLALLDGKAKGAGVRGGELLEQVENRIVGIVALRAKGEK